MHSWEHALRKKSGKLGTAASLLLLLSLTAPAGGQYMLVIRKDGTAAALLYVVGLLAFLSNLAVLRLLSANHQSYRILRPRLPRLPAIGGLSAILLVASLATIHTSSARVTLAAWAMSLLLALVAAAPVKSLKSPPGKLLARWRSVGLAGWLTREMAAVCCIVLVGSVLRLLDLEGIPSGIHGDEAGETLISASILEGRGPNPFGTAFFGDRALYFYLQAPFIAVFGRTVTAMRLFSALAGVATLPVFYLLMRSLFGVRPALIALALLAGNAVHVNYSRLGLNVIQIPLMTCISLYCLRRGQESRKAFWWLASGILGGLTAYFAFGGVLVAATMALYFAYLLVTRRSDWRAWTTGGAFSALGGAMAVIPIPVHMVGQSDPYAEHAMSRLIFNNWDWICATHNTSTLEGVLLGQLKANLLYFFTGHDFGPFYVFAGTPMLAVVLGPLVALGLVLMLLRAADDRYAMLSLWFWTVVVIAGVLTVGSPQSHRLLPAALAALTGVALVLDWLMDIGPRLVHKSLAPAFLVLSITLPTIAGYTDNANYFGSAMTATPWQSDTQQGRYVASLGSGYRAYSLAAPQLYFDTSVTRFLAPGVEGDSLLNPGLRLPLAVPSDRNLAFMVFPNMLQYLPLLRSLYQSAEIEEVRGIGNQVVFTALRVPKEEIARWQGLTAHYGGTERIEADAAVLGADAPTHPIEATWSGSIYVEQGGSYRFQASGPVSELLVDGVPTGGSRQLRLWTGWHSLQIKGRLPDSESRVTLEWGPPDQPISVVPTRWLDARQLAGNLRGLSTTETGSAIERHDRVIGFRNLGELFVGQGPLSAQWEGTVIAPVVGEYGFSLRSTGQAEIAINGRSVVTNGGDNRADRQTFGTAPLTAGLNSLSVRYAGRRDGGILEVLWTVPGGSPSLILPEALGPPRIAPAVGVDSRPLIHRKLTFGRIERDTQ